MSTDTADALTAPRDPSHYFLSIHAGQQRRHRDIPQAAIAATIREGEIRTTHKPGVRLFIREFPGDENPIGVVADTRNGEIVTVEWRHDD